MSGNVGRFTGRVREYAQHRRGYPARQVLRWLRAECGLTPEWRVADVAAGTGMLTGVFLGNGNPVIAVEPNSEMREVCEGLRMEWPELRVMEGLAEATGLEAGSVEMVTAGRAFHWFDPESAAAEFRRVLVPGGWVLLVSSGRKRDDSERYGALQQILIEHGTDPEQIRDRARREARMSGFFQTLAGVPETGMPVHRHAAFEAMRRMGWPEFAGMVQSMSCAPLAKDPRSAGMESALRGYFERWSDGGVMEMMEVCTVSLGRVEQGSAMTAR